MQKRMEAFQNRQPPTIVDSPRLRMGRPASNLEGAEDRPPPVQLLQEPLLCLLVDVQVQPPEAPFPFVLPIEELLLELLSALVPFWAS